MRIPITAFISTRYLEQTRAKIPRIPKENADDLDFHKRVLEWTEIKFGNIKKRCLQFWIYEIIIFKKIYYCYINIENYISPFKKSYAPLTQVKSRF